MRLRFLGYVGCLLSSSLVARADTSAPVYPVYPAYTYSIQGTFASGATLSGTLDAKITYPYFESFLNFHAIFTTQATPIEFSLPAGSFAKYYPPGFGVSAGTGVLGLLFQDDLVGGIFQNGEIVGTYPKSSVALCSASVACHEFSSPFNPLVKSFYNPDYFGPGGDAIDYLASGTATLVTTPEPSGFALLGTGVLGLAGLWRRRRA